MSRQAGRVASARLFGEWRRRRLLRRHGFAPHPGTTADACVALAGFAGAASWLCYFRALQIGEASRVAPIDKLSVVATLLLAVLFLGERPTAGVIFGTVLIVAGSLLIIRG